MQLFEIVGDIGPGSSPVAEREPEAGDREQDQQHDELTARREDHEERRPRAVAARLESKNSDGAGPGLSREQPRGARPPLVLARCRNAPATDQGTSAARVMVVVSLASHSDSANALLMCSSGYLCEMSRSKGNRVRLRTRKSRARGM